MHALGGFEKKKMEGRKEEKDGVGRIRNEMGAGAICTGPSAPCASLRLRLHSSRAELTYASA